MTKERQVPPPYSELSGVTTVFKRGSVYLARPAIGIKYSQALSHEAGRFYAHFVI